MKIGNIQKNRQRGFTLIEIAIVLVIIGLLLGGVLQGQQLIENSRVKSATNDFNGVAAGAFSYQDRYGRLPGDDDGGTADITDRGASWADIAAEGDADGVITGDADETFTGAQEVGTFFQMMRAAGFIGGDPTLTAEQALPQNPFGGLTGVTSADVMGDLRGTKLCMSNVGGSSAIALDTQLDDGNGITGRFRAQEGTAGENTAPTNDAGETISEDSIYTVCYRI